MNQVTGKVKSFEVNPIIVKELRSRMRGMRAFATLTFSLLLLGSILFALYQIAISAVQNTSIPISPQIGQILFTGLAFLMLFLVAAITPSITSGEISGERERQTYEMLMATPLSPARILWGKLFASMSYIFLILFAAIPMASLVFIYGGVNARDMLKTLIALVVITMMFGVIGLFYSALLNRSGRAAVLSYLTVAALLFGPIFAAILSGILHQGEPDRWIMTPSPIMVLASTFQPSVSADSISSAFWMLGSPVYWILGTPISADSIPRPAYHYGLPLYLLITLVLYLVSTRLVRPVRRWQIRWYDLLLALVLIFGLLGLVALGFLTSTNRYENVKILTGATPTPLMEIMPVTPAVETDITPAGQAPVETVTPTPEPAGLIEPGPRQVSSVQEDWYDR